MDLLDLLIKLEARLKGTPIEPYSNYVTSCIIIIIFILLGATVNRVLKPLWMAVKKICERHSRRKFIINKIYGELSFMESSDVFYAIENFIPTRFSFENDTGNDDEPSPDYQNDSQDKGRLLVEHFCKFEFDIKIGRKYYLCLADCGMGKTTFLINLYFRITKAGKYNCQFISLQDLDCLNEIDSIPEKGKTILLLDALDENARALANYFDFIDELERKTREFFRVVITSRTNFFENESMERLSNRRRINGIASKLSDIKKFYITPFTDDDIKRYLRMKYRWNNKKRKNAWKLIERNKNLSVRPMLLRFMDEVLSENQVFEYDFQLYECLFQKWIDREQTNNGHAEYELYIECLGLAKVIYYQWRKNGQIGILQEDLKKYSISGLDKVQIKGHAFLNRTNFGIYKFSHRSYWEYMLAKLALSDTYFACELLIKNFDRAVSFIEEMIQYYQNYPEELSIEAEMGIANYMLKYKQVEEAEKHYQKIVDEGKGNITQILFSMIQLVKCFQRELKFKTAFETIKKCLKLISEVPLSRETLPLYAQFGIVYADYCNMQHIKDGQIFLDQIIKFCNDQGIIEYTLLQCYELYCQCSLNYFYQQQGLAEIEQLISEIFYGDQYALYIYECARIQCMGCQNSKSFQIILDIVNNGRIFMDSYEQILWYGDLGVSGAVLGEWNNISVKCFEEGHYISDVIYMHKQNPYSVLIYQKFLIAYSSLEMEKQQIQPGLREQCINFIVGYIKRNHLQEEISVVQFIGYNYIQKNDGELSDQEELLEEQLEWANKSRNIYNIINAHLNCYDLYAGNPKTEKRAQDHLQIAYKRSQNPEGLYYRETTAYCNLLQTILCSHEETMDKNYIAKKLLKITPNIYGKDKRTSNIYKTLQEYFSSENDSFEVKACLEWLSCDFGFENLVCFYDSCEKHNQLDVFMKEMESLFVEKGIFTESEELDIKKFLEVKRKELVYNTENSLNNLLIRNRNFREKH